MMRHLATRHVTLRDQAADRYQRFAFELPAGIDSFEVLLEVEGGPEAVVDLGCEGPNGWRGWSGGARRSFVVAADDATPGYLPGDVVPGTWHVIAGLHTLPDGGAELRVTVEMPARSRPDHGPVEEPVQRVRRGSDRALPAPPGMRWYAGDPHSHSLHSDGALSLWQLANEGVRSGLDFLGVADHNTTSHHSHLGEVSARHGITLIPGQEVTSHAGHANAFGDIGFIDFRRPGQQWVDDVAARGGFMSINHPVSGDCSWLHQLQRAPGGVELYHSDWYKEPISTAALAWFQRWEKGVVLIGGGDFHDLSKPLRPGLPTTWVAAEECTPEAILAGIAAGRTTITASGAYLSEAEARPIHDTAPILIRQDTQLLALAASGLVLVSGSGRRLIVAGDEQRIAAPRDEGPYRLEDATRRVLALTA